MACSKCGNKNKLTTDEQRSMIVSPAVDFTLLTTKSARFRSGNKNFPITLPLIKIRPPAGYSINVLIKSHKHVAKGQTARQVVLDAIRLYEENGVKISERTAWFNANIHWLKQVNVKHGYTTVEELMMLAEKSSAFNKPKKLEDPSPENWGGAAWSFLGAYIAQSDNFSLSGFDKILAVFSAMLKDNFIGCPECAEHFAVVVEPITNQKEAAEWMFNTMNKIRTDQKRPTLSWKGAVKTHRWENL